MRVSVTSVLRAELARARAGAAEAHLALFVLGLGDDGDLPARALASELVPGHTPPSGTDPEQMLLIGSAPVPALVHTLFRAGERELSAALRASSGASVPVVLVRDVVRLVTVLDDVEAQEADVLLAGSPAGDA
jgi:hypothetical protein